MSSYCKCPGTPSRCSNKVHECKYNPCNINNMCHCNQKPENCKELECELKEMMEALIKLENESNKKIDKAREYQDQAAMLIAKALEAQCKANELLEDVECLEEESEELRKKIYNMIHRTIECYKNESCKCCCNCCKCNCCNRC